MSAVDPGRASGCAVGGERVGGRRGGPHAARHADGRRAQLAESLTLVERLPGTLALLAGAR